MPPPNPKLTTTLTTTLALLDQFSFSLSSPSPPPPPPTSRSTPSPLPLLSASASTLKSQSTKLSLLTLTAPFTPSAIIPLITALNDSILPSLLTATHLIMPLSFTTCYTTETHTLVRTALRELTVLVQYVDQRAKSTRLFVRGGECSESEKSVVTGQTGRVWDICDELVRLVEVGVVGLLVKKAEEYRDMVKDAIVELEEWDPDDDDEEEEDWGVVDDEFDGDVGEDGGKDSMDGADEGEEPEKAELHERLTERRDLEIKQLKIVAGIYAPVVRHRIRSFPTVSASTAQFQEMDRLMSRLRRIHECVDDMACAFYMENLVQAGKFGGLAREHAVEALEGVILPWQVKAEATREGNQSEDKCTVWARQWIERNGKGSSTDTVNSTGKG